MALSHFIPIQNQPRDYAWGIPGGISAVLGWPATDDREAELWLGAHPLCPSEAEGWRDLARWEQAHDVRIPYLMKVLAAAGPLSIQAHPSEEIAQAGFAAEEAAKVPRDAAQRNYKDPHAKPELIVAITDGFEALCGFQPLTQTIAVVSDLGGRADDAQPLREWERRLRAGVDAEEILRETVAWLLHQSDERLVASLTQAAHSDPQRYELIVRLTAEYPDDAGVAVAVMMNHVTLQAGESLWLPAGNIHAYLRGVGMELMGPSDNVLRGGLTPKHVDVAELSRVLDFTPGEPSWLAPVHPAAGVSEYRPASTATGAGVPFTLQMITSNAQIATNGTSIGIVLDGGFVLEQSGQRHAFGRGEAVFIPHSGPVTVSGTGMLALATV